MGIWKLRSERSKSKSGSDSENRKLESEMGPDNRARAQPELRTLEASGVGPDQKPETGIRAGAKESHESLA